MNEYQKLLLSKPDVLREALSCDGITFPQEISSKPLTARLRAELAWEREEYYPKVAEFVLNEDWEGLGRFLGEQIQNYIDQIIAHEQYKPLGATS